MLVFGVNRGFNFLQCFRFSAYALADRCERGKVKVIGGTEFLALELFLGKTRTGLGEIRHVVSNDCCDTFYVFGVNKAIYCFWHKLFS